MSVVAAYARNDLRTIVRDKLMIGVVFGPFLYSLMMWLLPPLSRFLRDRYGFDLVPYYPLAVSLFQVLGPAAVLGSVGGLILLEDKDQRTLAALRVTPAPPSSYPIYRTVVLFVVAVVFELAALALGQRVAPAQLARAVPAVLAAAAMATMLALLFGAVARNKVEGLAIFRAAGLLIFGLPIIPWFVDMPGQLLFGVLPSYWCAKAFWVAMDGGNPWPYAIAGIAYSGVVGWLLTRRLARQRT
ncbi:MAG TPA: hypothetical protein VE172_05130 [Stackebrandtia sp.]|jgi:fluoroquinolone transport system permease protein|uniref:hypothetical protein n=1 Tax=Stackebrandtia sp. TaxID=2023065 RepID=UPI002D537CED|nr:hypothetical protein [Stackebrandtia sp.]HZE38177.1 hypothetical protein [Stackebrandtia sp.]